MSKEIKASTSNIKFISSTQLRLWKDKPALCLVNHLCRCKSPPYSILCSKLTSVCVGGCFHSQSGVEHVHWGSAETVRALTTTSDPGSVIVKVQSANGATGFTMNS